MPPKALMEAMEKFVGDAFRESHPQGHGRPDASQGTYIQPREGRKVTVKNGPFTEAKEIVGGYALVETKAREEALELAREFMELHRVHWPAFECVSAIRQVEEF